MEVESQENGGERQAASDEEIANLLPGSAPAVAGITADIKPSKTPYLYRISCVAVLILMIVVGWKLLSGNPDVDQDETMHLALPPTAKKALPTSNVRFSEPFGPYPWSLNNYRKQVNATLNDIWDTWDVDNYPKFLTMMNIPAESWDIQKNKFIRLVIDNFVPMGNISMGIVGKNTGAHKKRPQPLKKPEYILGFTGSSVTAGHDNYFSESFPFVMERRIAPLFARILNVTVVTRNHALGNNPCYPYDACVSTHIGDDVDFLAWEQVRWKWACWLPVLRVYCCVFGLTAL
jgi:hypothetical protein